MAKKIYATGRRKEAVARVWLFSNGNGNFSINEEDAEAFFDCKKRYYNARKALDLLNVGGSVDLMVKVKGGGVSGQSDAIQLGIARALDDYNSDFHDQLKEDDLLTRDDRVKERKKYGQPKARKKSQYSKR